MEWLQELEASEARAKQKRQRKLEPAVLTPPSELPPQPASPPPILSPDPFEGANSLSPPDRPEEANACSDTLLASAAAEPSLNREVASVARALGDMGQAIASFGNSVHGALQELQAGVVDLRAEIQQP